MPLLEVVRAEATGAEAYELGFELGRKLGKTTVAAGDNRGFIVNRLLVPYMLDAIRAHEQGVGSIEDIDRGMMAGASHPMGPLTLADQLRSAEVGGAAGDLDPDAVRRELERVGESTAAILRAAEQTARELRGAAKRDAENQVASARTEAEGLRSQAEEFAGSTREDAEEETRRVRLEASQRAEEAVREAEARAESIIEDAIQRRRLLAARIDQLTERRDAIIAEVSRLADELKAIGDAEVVGGEPEPGLDDGEEAIASEG